MSPSRPAHAAALARRVAIICSDSASTPPDRVSMIHTMCAKSRTVHRTGTLTSMSLYIPPPIQVARYPSRWPVALPPIGSEPSARIAGHDRLFGRHSRRFIILRAPRPRKPGARGAPGGYTSRPDTPRCQAIRRHRHARRIVALPRRGAALHVATAIQNRTTLSRCPALRNVAVAFPRASAQRPCLAVPSRT